MDTDQPQQEQQSIFTVGPSMDQEERLDLCQTILDTSMHRTIVGNRERRRKRIPDDDPLAPKSPLERAKGAPEPPADHTATAQLPPSTHPNTMYLLRMRVRVSLRICTLSCASVQFCLP